MARTQNSINTFLLTTVAAISIGLVTACENTARGLEQDAAEVDVNTREPRAQAKQAARGLAGDAAQAARTVGAMAADAGEEVAARASALKDHVDVKAALMADSSVDASRIDVDVSSWTGTVTLNGSVRTANERHKADAIARSKSKGYKVVNNITVRQP